jgi:hypothetical protein
LQKLKKTNTNVNITWWLKWWYKMNYFTLSFYHWNKRLEWWTTLLWIRWHLIDFWKVKSVDKRWRRGWRWQEKDDRMFRIVRLFDLYV